MCRGACGPDCILNNCALTKELRCEEDDQGRYTGTVMQILSYTCGVAEGCVDHDACYDACNEQYGCSTWSSAYCRHGQVEGLTLTNSSGYCDQRAIEDHGYTNSLLWMRGYGIQPVTEIFEYTDTDFLVYEDYDLCPIAMKEPIEKEEPEAGTLETEESVLESDPGAAITESVQVPTAQPAAPADVHPCDLFPPGAENINRDETSCFASFETSSGDMSVQISKLYDTIPIERLCPIQVDPGFAITLSEADIGDCAVLVRRGVDGEPDVLGYVGWDIYAIVFPYSVRVGTHEIYPGNEATVYSTMYDIEEKILNP